MNTITKTLLIPVVMCALFAGGYLLRMLYVWPPGKESWIEQCFVMLTFHALCVIFLLPVVIWSVIRVWSKVRGSLRIALVFLALAMLAATVIVPELALKRLGRIRSNNNLSLLRLEPAEHAAKVLSLYEELRKKDLQAPEELGRSIAACLISNDLASVRTRFTQPEAFFQKEMTNSWHQVREEVELRRIPWNKVAFKGVEMKKLATRGTARVADIIMHFKVADDEFRIMLDEAYERDGRWYVFGFDWLGIDHIDYTTRGSGGL